MEADGGTSVDSVREWVRIYNKESGKEYYWNVAANETAWGIPGEVARAVQAGEVRLRVMEVNPANDDATEEDWQKVIDNTGNVYWWNVSSDETRWELPRAAGELSEEMTRMLQVGKAAGVTVVTDAEGMRALGLLTGDDSPPASSRFRKLLPKNLQHQEKEHNNGEHPAGEKSSKTSSFKKAAARIKASTLGTVTGSDSPPTSSKDSIEKVIRKKVKDSKGKVDAEEVVRGMEISGPTNVEHTVHVRFDKKNIRLQGMPADWALSSKQSQFGVALLNCPRLQVEGYRERIPAVLVLLRRILFDMKGCQVEGVFRLAPDKEACERVKQNINRGDGFEAMGDCRDANVPATLIKQWFRELEPRMLLNCLDREQLRLHEELAKDLDKIGPKMSALPEPEQSVFMWLLDLLADICAHKDVNKMTAKNLAICVAPNLYDPLQSSPMEALVLSQKVASLLENVLLWRIRENNSAAHAKEMSALQLQQTTLEQDEGQESATEIGHSQGLDEEEDGQVEEDSSADGLGEDAPSAVVGSGKQLQQITK